MVPEAFHDAQRRHRRAWPRARPKGLGDRLFSRQKKVGRGILGSPTTTEAEDASEGEESEA